MTIQLTLIQRHSEHHNGYGAGSGEIIREEYTCPCGSALVIYEKDDIPAFKETSNYSTCKSCSEKYTFNRGTAIQKS